jgi:hypothetical protein
MPRLRRRARIRKPDLSDLSKDQRYHLEHGMSWFGGFEDNLEAFTEAWEIHGEAILAEFIAKHPGRRPFAWWLLEHKKERPLLDGYTREEFREYRFGGHRFGFLHTNGWIPPVQEDEIAYLDRLNLLTPQEREILGLTAPSFHLDAP